MEATQLSLRHHQVIHRIQVRDITVDSNGITTTGIINGADNLTIDSGFYKTPKYSVGDYVWEDTKKMVSKMTMKRNFGVKVTLKDKKEI